ncbi:phage portal protein [Halomonas salina]|uniref:phage portal protein n=1 Tax=Halomonas salina TaxID=42565 RepID=UPI0009E09F71|nr:phage portal protein [Halomonas salina]
MKNIIDRIIEPFAPGTVVQRLAARQAIQAYEAARPDRNHRAHRESRSGDLAVQLAGKSLREQARFLDENHDLVTGIFDRLEERVIGANGIGIEPMPMDAEGNRLEEFAAELKDWWAEWSLAPETSGELTRPQMERLVCRTWLRDGEALAQQVQGRVPTFRYPTETPFALELLEPDYLPLEYDDPANGVYQGIERNTWRQIRGYHVYKSHPGDMRAWQMATKFVPAESMIHIAHRKRLGQSRGITILHAVLKRLADLKDYEESERVAARLAAALTMYIKKGDPALFGTGGQQTASGNRTIPVAPGMVFDGLQPGEDVGMIESNRPSSLLEGFRSSMIRAVAAGTRSGYSTTNRDYNGTYSAQRQELVEAQLGYDLLQGEFIDQWARPVYRNALRMAIATGRIRLPRELDRRTLNNAFYLGPVMPWINPVHEAQAWKETIRAGGADEAEMARARGRNPQELKRNREAEIQRNREAGLVYSSDPFHEYYAGDSHADPASDGTDSGADGEDAD